MAGSSAVRFPAAGMGVASPPLPLVIGLAERAAARRGVRMVIEPRFRHAAQLIYPDGRVGNLRGNRFDLNPSLAARTAHLRPLVASLLAEAGVAVPRGDYFLPRDHIAKDGTTHDRTKAPEFARTLGYPLYAKTSSRTEREWVRLVQGPEDLDATLSDLFRREPAVFLQARVSGQQLGGVLVDGRVHLAYRVDEPDGVRRIVAPEDLPEAVRSTAARALAVLGLRYGAVDVIWPGGEAAPVLLDIQTLPDLEMLAGLEPGGHDAVAALVEQIVLAMGVGS